MLLSIIKTIEKCLFKKLTERVWCKYNMITIFKKHPPHMGKTKEGQGQGWEVGMAGMAGVQWGKNGDNCTCTTSLKKRKKGKEKKVQDQIKQKYQQGKKSSTWKKQLEEKIVKNLILQRYRFF